MARVATPHDGWPCLRVPPIDGVTDAMWHDVDGGSSISGQSDWILAASQRDPILSSRYPDGTLQRVCPIMALNKGLLTVKAALGSGSEFSCSSVDER